MDLPVQQFPILDSGQMSPFHQAFQSGLANYQNLLKAQYTPATLQADVATKQAYAKYLPMQAMATALGNPMFISSLSKDQLKGMLSAFTNMGMNQAVPGMNPGNQGMTGTPNQGGGSGFLQNVMNRFGLGSSPQSSPMNATPFAMPNAAPSAQSAQPSSSDVETPEEKAEDNIPVEGSTGRAATSGNEEASTEEPAGFDYAKDSAENDPNTAAGQLFSKLPNTSMYPVNNEQSRTMMATQYPSVERKQGLENIAEWQKANRDMWTKQHQIDNQAGYSANDYKTALDKFHQGYKETSEWLKGGGRGWTPAIGSAATDADTAAGALIAAYTRAQQLGHITGLDYQTAQALKPGRYMSPEAEKHAYNFNLGVSDRTQEHQAFNDAADKLKLSPTEAGVIWNQYINDKPFYNSKKGELINKNLDKWPSYLRTKTRDDILTHHYKVPTNAQVPTNAPVASNMNVRNPAGSIGITPQSNVTKTINGVTYKMDANGDWSY